jgi:signal transduction histidine kinase
MTLGFAIWIFVICFALIRYSAYDARRQGKIVLETLTSSFMHDISEVNQDERDQDSKPVNLLQAKYDFLSSINKRKDNMAARQVSFLVVDKTDHILMRSDNPIPDYPHYSHKLWIVKVLPSGDTKLVLAYSLAKANASLRALTILLLIFSLCMIASISLSSWILVGRTLLPIHQISQQALKASVKTLHPRLMEPSRDMEIVELVTTLNGLLHRLGETTAVRGRFYAAASHELRTPLQALSGHLEVALSRQRNADEYKQFLQEAREQSNRLIVLTRDLLFLNQLDIGNAQTYREPLAIAEICERSLRILAGQIHQKELEVKTELEIDGNILAPPNHAEMLVRNILENAVKYASHRGSVQISLSEDEKGTSMRVYNICDPIESWNPELLCEPFYRLDASRNAQTGGNGLGLAICKAIIEADQWEMKLDYDGKGVMVTVNFPPCSQEESVDEV